MRTVLLCPGERPAVGFLSEALPLVAVPMLGRPLISYWLDELAGSGVRDVLVLATDRPELVRAAVGDGSRWGMRLEVQAELQELAPVEAAGKYQNSSSSESVEPKVIALDHLPGLPEIPLFRSYRDWFLAALAWMSSAPKQNRIGLRQLQPQVWCGLRTRIAPSAKLVAPCWIGDLVWVGPEAVIGPYAVLENRVVVESAAEIRSSLIGSDTFVGTLTRVENSIAWGSTLIDWETGSCTQVPDAFLLSTLGQCGLSRGQRESASWFRKGLSTVLMRPWELVAGLHGKLRKG